jgi:hypothetical protein
MDKQDSILTDERADNDLVHTPIRASTSDKRRSSHAALRSSPNLTEECQTVRLGGVVLRPGRTPGQYLPVHGRHDLGRPILWRIPGLAERRGQ